jgi:hypothetical protein
MAQKTFHISDDCCMSIFDGAQVHNKQSHDNHQKKDSFIAATGFDPVTSGL